MTWHWSRWFSATAVQTGSEEAALARPDAPVPAFPGFFAGGFECSTHRLATGRRLDLAVGTRHLEFADADYRRLSDAGLRVARDGFAWHRIEAVPGRRDFTSVEPLVRAARRHGVRVIWDLMHFGWPDDVDVFSPAFVARFAAFARAAARLLAAEGDTAPWFCPVNEMSFLSWAGADVAMFNPLVRDRGFELKCQLVRASIAAIEAVREVSPQARVFLHDPAYHVHAPAARPEDFAAAEASRRLQFQACDLLTGRAWPMLGGRPDYVDVIGINYYPWNQWEFGTAMQPGAPVTTDDPRHRPLHAILLEWQRRYGKPMYIAETGCEGEGRAAWFGKVCDEAEAARERGVELLGICLYPIVSFPGWDDDRHCRNGLWDYADDDGHREVDAPFADELRIQQRHRQRRGGSSVVDAGRVDRPRPLFHAASETST